GAVSLTAALAAGGPVTLDAIDPFVDGAAVKRIGSIGHRVMADLDATITEHPSLPGIAPEPLVGVLEDG
ncbi:threonine dehydratase, partial [Streptomyces sp. SID10244]|nr:threonine dehydratase [Streptomyces sp. SID10244]